MRELSLHINDIVQNSIDADATIIKIFVKEDIEKDNLVIKVEDNGKGIPKEKLDVITDPFETSRTTRRVGLGLSLLEAATQRCEGSLIIKSIRNVKTEVVATFRYNHIDRAPLGNMIDTILSIILSLKENSDLIYEHHYNNKMFTFDTREIKSIIGNQVSINQIEIMNWIKEYIEEGFSNLMEV
ncbi:ATP-binding protein [Alkalibaculum sp. M08DMB]|uniref:histidine kinase n=1 Tax=Alkalibaculum sporogenes TaxID=2655001 RepID=A0A6A7K5Y3_9FIRM|nr:ATP-binding protein [Alkalibaculum sporogenes]MPW24830.1 ATP-binding protein [Alkalibaculum sporogenes]